MSKLKQYKVRIRPNLKKKTTEEEGTKTVASYIRTTDLREGARKFFKRTNFIILDLVEQSSFKLGGNPTSSTVTIFQNTHKVLYETLEEIIGQIEAGNKELGTVLSSHVIVLSDLLPGRFVKRPVGFKFYMMGTDKESGAMKRQVVYKKQADGSYKGEDGISSNVSYFLFEHQASDEEAEEVVFQAERDSVAKYKVVDTDDSDIVEPPVEKTQKSKSSEDENPDDNLD